MRKVKKRTKKEISDRERAKTEALQKAVEEKIRKQKAQRYMEEVFPLWIESQLEGGNPNSAWLDKAQEIKDEFDQPTNKPVQGNK